MNASSTITARSHAICISLPPPTQIPLIRATVGFPISRIAVTPRVHRAEPLPVLALVADEALVRPGAQVRADAERAARAGEDDDADLVVVRRLLAGAARARRSISWSKAFSTSGRLKVIVARGGGLLVDRIELSTRCSQKWTLNGTPIVGGVLPGGGELRRGRDLL